MTTEKDENFEKLINDLETTYGEFYPECGVDRAVNAIENFGKFFNEA